MIKYYHLAIMLLLVGLTACANKSTFIMALPEGLEENGYISIAGGRLAIRARNIFIVNDDKSKELVGGYYTSGFKKLDSGRYIPIPANRNKMLVELLVDANKENISIDGNNVVLKLRAGTHYGTLLGPINFFKGWSAYLSYKLCRAASSREYGSDALAVSKIKKISNKVVVKHGGKQCFIAAFDLPPFETIEDFTLEINGSSASGDMNTTIVFKRTLVKEVHN